jgi:small basic protein
MHSLTCSYPGIRSSNYLFNVMGHVDRPLELTLDEQRAIPKFELVRAFQFVTSLRVPQVHWASVQYSNVLHATGVCTCGNARLQLVRREDQTSDKFISGQKFNAIAAALVVMRGTGLNMQKYRVALSLRTSDLRPRRARRHSRFRDRRPRRGGVGLPRRTALEVEGLGE